MIVEPLPEEGARRIVIDALAMAADRLHANAPGFERGEDPDGSRAQIGREMREAADWIHEVRKVVRES